MGRKTVNGGFDPALMPNSPDDKERLRQQLEAGRKMAREPHVLRLAALHEQMQMRMLFGVQTKH